MNLYARWLERLRRRRETPRADPARIHALEYELGFRDDAPPPSIGGRYADTVYTGRPGDMIYVGPTLQRGASDDEIDALLG